MFIHVSQDTVECELRKTQKPVLLACLHPEAAQAPQVATLKQVAALWGSALKVCLLLSDCSGLQAQRLGIAGTPTFLLFSQGHIRGQLLGQADWETLTAFVRTGLGAEETMNTSTPKKRRNTV